MKMSNRTLFALLALMIFITSCSRAITPYDAAHGKAKCGRYLR